jgi:aquaporin NIP
MQKEIMFKKILVHWFEYQYPALLRRAGAEIIGTYMLVTVGCGAIIVNALTGALTPIGIAVTFGLIIMVMISAVGHISGAHFNPAVTVALAFIRQFSWRDVPIYIGSQILGAALGALTLKFLFGSVDYLGATIPRGSLPQSLGLEILLTTTLMFVITSVSTGTHTTSKFPAMLIGVTVTLNALLGGSISGASMNPARSFGPACVAGIWQAHWIYWLGPLLGAGLGAIIYQLVRTPSKINNQHP